jgi:hypothetical protein
MKISDRLFQNRVKPIVIFQFVLIIPMAVFVLLSFKTYPVNFFYSGCTGMTLATSMFLLGIEQYLKKKKSVPFFVLTLIIILVAVQNFFQD